MDPLSTRMADFFANYFVRQELKKSDFVEELYTIFEEIVTQGRVGTLTHEEAAKRLLPYQSKQSERGLTLDDLVRLVLEDAVTEAELIKIGISPEDITDSNPPAARWEKYLERMYINDAEASAFERIKYLEEQKTEGAISEEEFNSTLEREFPWNHWWGRKMRELYVLQHGVPYVSDTKPVGTERAISFFGRMDRRRREKEKRSKIISV